MNRKERIEKVLADWPDASADDVARELIDEDVAAGEYEGCSSELEGWYGEYENAAREVIAAQGGQRKIGTDAAYAVGRFEADGPRGYRSRLGGPLRATRTEAEADYRATLDSPERSSAVQRRNR